MTESEEAWERKKEAGRRGVRAGYARLMDALAARKKSPCSRCGLPMGNATYKKNENGSFYHIPSCDYHRI